MLFDVPWKTKMPSILSIILVIGLGPLIYFAGVVNIAEDNRSIMYLIVGSYLSYVGNCVNYWMGTTFSSGTKDEMLFKSKPNTPIQ